MNWLKVVEIFNGVSMWLAEWIIVIILIDDIYGFKEMRKAIKKHGKMFNRRAHRRFLQLSKKYFRRHDKPQPPEEGTPEQ